MTILFPVEPRHYTLHGFSGVAHSNKGEMGFRLMTRMWNVMKPNKVKNNGINVWVYDVNDEVFAGVVLESPALLSLGLEVKTVALEKYAYHKHVGPYSLLKQVGAELTEELKSRNLTTIPPLVEVYGHWGPDESKLETEILIGLKRDVSHSRGDSRNEL